MQKINLSSTVIKIILLIIVLIVLIVLPILYSETATDEWRQQLDDNTSLNIQQNFWIYWAVIGSVLFLFILMFFLRGWIPNVFGYISKFFNLISNNTYALKKIGLLLIGCTITVGIIYFIIYLRNNYSVMENKTGSDKRSISDIINCEFCSLNGSEGDTQFNAHSPNHLDSIHLNQEEGSTEFTWSCMVKIEDWYLTNFNHEKMIMVKGTNPDQICNKNNTKGECSEFNNSTSKLNSKKFKEQCPGLWLDKEVNNLLINFTTKINNKKAIETIVIEDIPVGSWVQIAIVTILNNIDVYINGKLKRSEVLDGIPMKNKGNLYLGYGGGFSGFTQKIRYINSGLSPNKILELYNYDKYYLV